MTKKSEAEKKSPFRQIKLNDNTLIIYTEDCPLEPGDNLFEQQYWLERNAIAGSAAGRGTTLFLSTASGDFILRQYLRGGLPGKLLSDQFWFNGIENTRAWQEMHLLDKMVSLGLPTPYPVAARIVRSGLICRNQILIKRIPDARDLHEVLCQQALDNEIWYQVGHVIRQLHSHQIYHHDLNIKNIMMDKHDKVWLIDFDKCGERSGDDWKSQNIERLLRSLNKERGRMPDFYWTSDNWKTLLDGYHAR